MPRQILHCDFNGYYASVECLYHPEVRHLPVAVGGDVEQRHGIILAKNEHAKKYDIKTGEALWQARKKCPHLVILPPDYKKYLHYSRQGRIIFGSYTNKVEPFGLDEAWLDISSPNVDGQAVAEEIRERTKRELGLTVSIGVADNKIFAKLGSDIKKPDAVTVITKDNYKSIVWSLPAEDLLYVGRATSKMLHARGVSTIGDLASIKPDMLKAWFGINGLMLWQFANGYDTSPVSEEGHTSDVKSIGNSTTTPRDLVCDDDVHKTMIVLSESVAMRLREHGFVGTLVEISIRDNELLSFTRQRKIHQPTQLSTEIVTTAMELFRANYDWKRYKPIRSVGVRVSDLRGERAPMQTIMWSDDEEKRSKLVALENTIDDLRGRFGHFCVQKGILLADRQLTHLNPKDDHVIHPVSFLK